MQVALAALELFGGLAELQIEDISTGRCVVSCRAPINNCTG